MNQAADVPKTEDEKQQVGQFYLDFANHLLNMNGYYQAWRLQDLTDRAKLPDYDEGYN